MTFVVNRNINVSNVCIVGCAFCGFGQAKRSPDAYEHEREDFARRVAEALAFGATEICMQSGIHPDWGLEDYVALAALAKEIAPDIHLHAYSPMEIAHMCDISGLSPRAVFARLREAGLDSTPGTAAEVLHDGVRERISPNKLPVARWVEIIEASHRAGLRSTVTVMFGHIEEPDELAEHMRVVRALQERTGGFTEFVPLSFIPFHTLLGRTHGVEEISREENLSHTAAFRLALGRTIPSLQASWVKMGLDAATEALRWGVNDLGGTLMEESISRMAGSYHGVRLDPADLIGAAHRAGRPAAERTTLYEIRRRYELDGRRVAGEADPRPAAALRGADGGADLGRDGRAVHGRVRIARLRGADVLRRGPPLRAGASARASSPTTITPYEVPLDGETVWPQPDSRFPPSVVRTHDPRGRRGSCSAPAASARRTSRRTRMRKDEHPDGREVDALMALAQRMARAGPRRSGRTRCCCSATRSTPTRSRPA